MPKYIVDLVLDGYNSLEEMEKACDEFIRDQLDGGTSVTITKIPRAVAKVLEGLKDVGAENEL